MALTVGADSYCSMLEAERYCAGRLGAGPWTRASTDDRERALREAFTVLEGLRYQGRPAEYGQPAQWPRAGITGAGGVPYPADAMPDFLIAAQCEEALALLRVQADAGAETRAALQQQGVRETSLGDVREVYAVPARPAGLASPQAYARIQPHLLRAPSRVWSGA